MKYIAIYLLLTCTTLCHAQNSLRLTHLNVENGLSQSSVYSIMQDSYGFIWMATGDGLNRYDGKTFIAYKSKLKNALNGQLKDRNINSTLHEDINHNLWFAADEGVYCLERRTGQFVVKLNKHHTGYAATFAASKDNKIWFYVPAKGMHCFFTDGQKPRLYKPEEEPEEPTNPILVKGLLMTKTGIWVVDDNGLIFFDTKTFSHKRVLQLKGLNSGCLLQSGQLALPTKGGIWMYNPVNGSMRFVPLGSGQERAIQWREIAEDTIQHNLYIGELFGGTMAKLHLTDERCAIFSIQKNTITHLFIDRSQNLWIGTEGAGAYRVDIKPDKFFCYKPENTNDGFMVKSLYRDTGDIWLGTYAHGFFRYNTASKKLSPLPITTHEKDSYCGVMMKDSSGALLMTENNKIIWVDPASGKKIREQTLQSYFYPKDMKHTIYSVIEWKRGHYLAATNQNMQSFTASGYYPAFKNTNFLRDSIANGWGYNFYRAHDGIIYMGKRNGYCGIRVVNDSNVQLVTDGLRGITIRHFYKSNSTPLLWLASEQGLVAWDSSTRKYTVFDETSSGLANSYIYAILPENDSTLWLSTNQGIAKAAVHYRKGGKIAVDFLNYSANDGLQSNEFNTGAFHACADGTMIFGGINGFNWFHPRDVVSNPHKAIPAITGIYINDTLVTTDTAMYVRSMVLPYRQNTIGLTLRALEYTMPEQNVFAYKMEGVDKEWVQTANDRVRYANLQPGTYRFYLKVRNNELVWNDEPLSLSITILPPWWQTWWFRLAIVLLLTGIAIMAARQYARRKVLAKTHELEQQHALNMERIRISKDVHDDIGSGLSKISLLSEIANRKIRENQAAQSDINHISAISKELVDNMRDLIWLLNPENTSLDNLAARIREYAADYLEGMSTSVFFEFPETIPAMEISRDVQRNMLLTVKEALNNAVKHAHATVIRIHLGIDNQILSVKIADNGSGFDMQHISGRGNGLRNMRHRIEVIGGSCTITSSVDGGTTIQMQVPFSKITHSATSTA